MKERSKRGTRLRRTIAVLALGVAIGTMIVATPASAHFRSSIDHIWSHIRPKADARYLPGANLPAGKTMRGAYMVGYTANAGGEFALASFSFPQALSTNPTPHFIGVGATPPAECPGTNDIPRAAPGHLCVYANAGANFGSSLLIADPSTNNAGSSGRWGFYIQISSSAGGLFWSNGTWAVTAPLSSSSTSGALERKSGQEEGTVLR